MKLIIPFIGGGLVLWYTREVMPADAIAGVPFAAQYPEIANLLAAAVAFIVLAMIVRKKKYSTP